MAETSVLCNTTYASSFPTISPYNPSSSSFIPSSFPNHRRHPRSFSFRIAAKPSDGGYLFGNDDDDHSLFRDYPWHQLNSDDQPSGIQWVREDKITLFTADGLIQLGGSLSPKRISPSEKQKGQIKAFQKHQRFQESDYMDPKQSLCLGALFDIAATNGLDMGRRLCIIGFCRSIEMLSDVVEDTVLEHGGEVVLAEKASESGLQEKLSMKVAVPYLWGVPPVSETLHLAVRSGGGIVQKVFWQWDFL
ncbi:uncharacterized protein LOC141592153 [Silene latifolia]|uniref:uncharacterized protein LOC141592153 n=1 Tax=Silene latifolia TaxID=37657 RepID=UPI003D77502E